MRWDCQNLFVKAGISPVIAGFVIAGSVSTYFTVLNSAGLSNVVRYNGVFVVVRFVIAGCHCIYIAAGLS